MPPRHLKLIVKASIPLLLLLLTTGLLSAHAELVGSEPADGQVLTTVPTTVKLFFNEPIEPDFFALQVYASDSTRVDRNNARVSATDARVLEVGLGDVRPGTFTVVWRALSLDSHVVSGSFVFAVGEGIIIDQPLDLALPPAGAPFAVESATRWLTFLTFFVLLGGFAFMPLMALPGLATLNDAGHSLADTLRRRWLILAWLAAGLLIVISFAALLFQASSAAGTPLNEVLAGRAVSRVLTTTRYGWLWGVRVLLLLGIIGVLAGLNVARGSGSRRLWWAGVIVSSAAMYTLSAAGHPAAVPTRTALAIAFDWVHLLAGGLWVGGLIQLGLAIPTVMQTLGSDDRRRLLGRLVPRFSWLAGLSVVALTLTGLYASVLHIPNWAALADTPYGAMLSGKLVVFVPLLALGALNLLFLHPRFRRAGQAARTAPEDAAQQRTFRWLVLGEVVLAVGILAVTGMLTGTPPASSLAPEGRPFNATQSLPTYNATLIVTPNQAGQNRVMVTLADPQGNPPPDIQQVRLTLTMLDMEMGAREVEARRTGAGRYEAEGGYLSMSGNWQATLTVRRPSGEEQSRFQVHVGQPPDANRPAFSPALIVMNAWNVRSLAALTALACAGLIWISGTSRRRQTIRRQTQLMAGVLLVVGLGVGGVAVADAYRQSLPNPVPTGPASIARGQEVYIESCVVCHGARGRGDGPAAISLNPRPADFRVHMAAGHTDQQLFYWVTHGLEGTAMPAFKDQLTVDDRWHVINFIRTFAPVEQ